MSKFLNDEIRRAKAAGQNIGRLLEAPEGMFIHRPGQGMEPVEWILAIDYPDGHMEIVETLPDGDIPRDKEFIRVKP